MTRRAAHRTRSWLAAGLAVITVACGLSLPGTANAAVRPAAAAPVSAPLVAVSRINVGGPAVMAAGQAWAADRWYGGGRASATVRRGDIAGTTNDVLYRSERSGSFSYEIPVPRVGDYVVRLHFAEYLHRAAGRRVFSANLEGGPAEIRDLDLVASAGSMRAVVKQITVPVRDGRLTLTTSAKVGHAKLSAVEVLNRALPPRPATTATATPLAAPDPASAGRQASTRDHTLQPFSSTSIWNLPIGTGAVFEPVGASRTTNLIGTGGVWVNEGEYSHPIARATPADPVAAMTDTNDGSRSGSYRIPTSAAIAQGSDAHMHVISPDGRSIDEAWAVTRRSATSYTTGRHHTVDLHGSGVGPRNGTRAYGGSAIGGLIRAWEVDPTHPRYTGVIRHPLAIALRNDQLLHTGGGVGYRADGTMLQGGYVWPATEQDWDSPWTYSGRVPMGTYLAIPSTVDLASLGLSPQGMMLAHAYQDYGAYVTDRAGDMILAFVEPSPAGKAFTGSLLGPNWGAADLNKIRAQLRVVTNNAPGTPNGAPLDGPRRAPLLP
jgi:hypothetical protein